MTAAFTQAERAFTVETLNQTLVGHWKMEGDARDHSGNENHGRPHRVDFTAPDRNGKPGSAARFNGIDACITIPRRPETGLGTGPFTVTAWIRVDEEHTDVIGDIVSQYDPATRRGFNFYITAGSVGYNAHSDTRMIHFGIDNAMEAPWEDCGILHPTNTFVSSLAVHNGSLYAAQADALGDGSAACHIYRYTDGQNWEDCGRVSHNPRERSAYALLVHKGQLYCGTGRQDWVVSGPEQCAFAHVYRYLGGTEWEDIGQVGRNYRVLCLASFRGDLYCGTDVCHPVVHGDSNRVFRYSGGKEWEDCGRPGDQRHVFCLIVHNGELYAGGNGEIHRYLGGKEWEYLGTPFGNTQVHCLQVYRGALWAGTWPQGHIIRYRQGQDWDSTGVVGDTRPNLKERINEINDLTVHNGSFFAGVIPKGEVYRYDGEKGWTMIRRLFANPAYSPTDVDSWARVPCLTTFGGRLYAGTGTCRGYAEEKPRHEAGRIYRTQIGQMVSYDRSIGSGWRHVAAVREQNHLRLYVDGQLVSQSEGFAGGCYDLTTDASLQIRFGSVDYFSGDLNDVRLYGRDLNHEEITTLAGR